MAAERDKDVSIAVGGKTDNCDTDLIGDMGKLVDLRVKLFDEDNENKLPMNVDSVCIQQGSGKSVVVTLEFIGDQSQKRTPCQDERTAHFRGTENGDYIGTNELGSDEEFCDRQEETQTVSLPLISGIALEDKSASLRTVNLPEHTDSSPADVANVKNAALSQPARTEPRTDETQVARKAKEEGCVEVVFLGRVTQDSCCKFVCEILKFVLYQRQQLPMTYDQLVHYQKKQLAANEGKEVMGWRSSKACGWDGRKCQRTLQELEEVLQQLENLFSLSLVPRVLLLLGGTITLPKELYEVNMEALLLGGGGDGSLRTTPCLRQLFRTLFVADILSDARPVRLMATTVMVLSHRDCGVGWFRPRLEYRVPARVKRQVISLSSDPSLASPQPIDWEDYAWFQAPVTIKGFCK